MRREIHRGAYVSGLGADDIRDLYAVRRLVEVAAVRELAAEGGEPRRLAAAVDKLDEAVVSGDVRRILDADLNCHHALVELVDSDRLGILFDGVETQLRLSMAPSTADVEPATLLEDHRAVEGGERSCPDKVGDRQHASRASVSITHEQPSDSKLGHPPRGVLDGRAEVLSRSGREGEPSGEGVFRISFATGTEALTEASDGSHARELTQVMELE